MKQNIHIFLEQKSKNGKWKSLDKWSISNKVCYVDYENSFFPDLSSSYDLFTKEISEVRGIPEGINSNLKNCLESWKSDSHSHSWLLASEIRDFDWEKKLKITDYVSMEMYYEIMKGKSPFYTFSKRCYPSDQSEEISEEEMRNFINKLSFKTEDELYKKINKTAKVYYCKATWEDTYEKVYPWYVWFLKDLEKFGDLNSIRLVFWYDN